MVPLDSQSLIGRKEFWRSLRTDSEKIVLRRLASTISAIEAKIEIARHKAGQIFDDHLLTTRSIPSYDDTKSGSLTVSAKSPENLPKGMVSMTLAEACERYIGDPTNLWSSSTREVYETSRKVVVSVSGGDFQVSSIARSLALPRFARSPSSHANPLYQTLSSPFIARSVRACEAAR